MKNTDPKIFTREEILALMHDPSIRICDHPGTLRFCDYLIRSQDLNPALHAELLRMVGNLSWLGMQEAGAFRENMPPFQEPLVVDTWTGRLSDGRAYGFLGDSILEGLGVVGQPGTGKSSQLTIPLSQLAQHARIVIFDAKRELRRLAFIPRLGLAWTVVDFKKLPLAFCMSPPGIPARNWGSIWVRAMAQSYSLFASRRPLLNFYNKVLRQFGSVNLEHLEDAIVGWKTGRGFREAGYREALLWVLRLIRESAPNLNVAKSNTMEFLFSGTGGVVIEYDLPIEHMSTVAAWMLLWVYHWRRQSRVNQPPIYFVLEDATTLLDTQTDKESPGGVSLLAEIMLLGRALGIGVIWVTHSFSDTSSKIKAATRNYIITGPSGKDVRALARTVGLTKEQRVKMQALKIEESLAYFPNVCPAPQLCTFPYIASETDESVIEQRVKVFLGKVIIERERTTPKTTVEDFLTSDQLRVLCEAAFHPDESVTRIYERAGIDREQGRRIVEALMKLGFIKSHRVSGGNRGGMLSLIDATQRGKDEMARRGFQPIELPTGGGFLHKVGAYKQSKIDRKAGAHVSFEVNVYEVRIDMLSEFKEGRVIAYQFGMSDPDYEAKVLPTVVRTHGFDEVVFVGRDKGFVKKVEAKLREKLTTKEREKLTMKCLGEVLASEDG